MSKLQGKVALVTGASKGIGAAIAKALAAEGAAIVVAYSSSQSGAQAVVSDIEKSGGRAVVAGGDVTKANDAASLVQTAIDKFGRLDILVNNSGVYAFAPLEEITAEEFHRQFGTNVLGTLLVTQAAAKHLGEGASVINIGSAITSLTPAATAVYTGTKSAIDGITSVLAKELAPKGIRVNAIRPGYTETEGTHSSGITGSDMEKGMVSMTPLGRAGQPDDIARVAVFLASDDAGWITGDHLNVAGGLQ
ncbi:glucose 1-dehydrogenase [Caballeronia sp. dw_276]|jgi:3-oxoacyl-[acyl-carrier protein] reductase|uniref:SDR family NAD(P)-dependent oxidoreductase n=1 Tax=Caballeronia sp. dw_276 TaxID=2719795 RepID=UPI001BD26A5A|nr:glucose 1-dehydrogenase [Caballeronia sp. dw_276]